jgi:hypothetical protein
MAIGMRVKFKYWMILLAIHISLVFLPSFVIENKITASIPFYTIWGVLEFGDYLGLTVLGEITEDMFMAPITFIGWSFVLFFWLLFHWLLSLVVCNLIRKINKET